MHRLADEMEEDAEGFMPNCGNIRALFAFDSPRCTPCAQTRADEKLLKAEGVVCAHEGSMEEYRERTHKAAELAPHQSVAQHMSGGTGEYCCACPVRRPRQTRSC